MVKTFELSLTFQLQPPILFVLCPIVAGDFLVRPHSPGPVPHTMPSNCVCLSADDRTRFVADRTLTLALVRPMNLQFLSISISTIFKNFFRLINTVMTHLPIYTIYLTQLILANFYHLFTKHNHFFER